MPAKKKTTAKKKTVKKKAAKKVVKKATVKKVAKKAAPKKTVKKAKAKFASEPMKKIETPAPPPAPPKVIEKKPKKEKRGIPCAHCDATGVCAAGDPYDKSRRQIFGAKTRLTSCVACLVKAGQHKNSKKLVDCRLCDGDGMV
jgi:hypothetical protein